MGVPAVPDRRPSTATALTVLLVDDDEMVCRSIARVLVRLGFSVTAVQSAVAALTEAEACRFDVIVTDHNMPTMSGAELVDRLMATDPTAAARIVLTSGDLHTPANEALIKRTGIRGIQKPFQLAELALVLRAAAHRGGALTAA